MSKKQAAVVDVIKLKDELNAVDADYDEKFRQLEIERKEARSKKMQGLKDQRGQLAAQRNEIDVSIRHLDKLIQDLGGKAPRSPGAKGTRRGAEELKADAEKVVAYLKKNPKSKASAIREATGVNWGLNLKEFVKKNAGESVKSEGAKASMTYSL